MEATVDLGWVHTWYAEYGSGDPLVYLHSGLSDASELDPVLGAYSASFRVFTPERRGHGHSPDTPGPYDFDMLAIDTAAFLTTVVGERADLVGYEDGATTALKVALWRPELVRRLVLISGQYDYTGLRSELRDIDVEATVAAFTDSELAGRHGTVSPDGPHHFPVVVRKVLELARMQARLLVEQLTTVRARTLVMTADDDAVRIDHTLNMYVAIPDCELAVVPGTSHALVQEKPELVTRLVLDFLTLDPVPTLIPIRRR